MKISARWPRMLAANATARPKFPPDAAITPGAGTSDERSLLNAPRGLNEPVCCMSSSFKVTRQERSKTPGSSSSTGVRRTYGSIRPRAARISSGPMMGGASIRLPRLGEPQSDESDHWIADEPDGEVHRTGGPTGPDEPEDRRGVEHDQESDRSRHPRGTQDHPCHRRSRTGSRVIFSSPT